LNQGKIMPIAIEIDSRKLIKSLYLIPRKEKILIAESIEKDLLSEWDDYEESPEVKNKVKVAMEAYRSGNVVNLCDII
jgi:hypothetical protein